MTTKNHSFPGKALFLALAAIYASFFLSVCVPDAYAAGAVLYITPSGGNYSVGDSFTVKVMVNSGGGAGINASDGTVNYDKTALSATKISKTGSIFSLWTAEPAYSNADGKATFSGGNPSAYTGNSGTIMSITFKAIKVGSTKITISGANVLAADGMGTNILSQAGEGNYTIAAAAPKPSVTPTPAVTATPVPEATKPAEPAEQFSLVVSSPTHPAEDKWYSNKSPKFLWNLPKDASAVRVLLDKNTDSKPTVITTPPVTEHNGENLEDGIWYLHLQIRRGSTWGKVTTRRAMIDTAPPQPFQISIKQKDPTDNYPILLFNTTDDISGVLYYEIKIGDGAAFQVSVENIKSNPYRMPFQAAGSHAVIVKAFDAAGNYTEGTTEVIISGAEELEKGFGASIGLFGGTWAIVISVVLGLLVLVNLLLLYLLLFRKSFVGLGRSGHSIDMGEFKDKLKEIFSALKEEAEEQIKMSDKKSAVSDSEKRSIEKMKDALDVSQELIVRELEELEHHKKEEK